MTNLDDFLSDTPMLQQQQQQAQEASKTQQDAKSPAASEQTKEVAQGETASPLNPASWKGLPALVLKGERHTGTHWLAAILRHNFPSDKQWLHVENTIPDERCSYDQPFAYANETMCCWTSGKADGRCVFDPQPHAYVFLVRHPYPWLLSMRRKPYEYDRDSAQMSISKYIRWPFTQFAVEGIGAYANPLRMYNAKVKSYLDVTDHPKVLVRHEDLYDLKTLNRKLLQPLLAQGFELREGKKSLEFPPFSPPRTNNPEVYNFTPGDFSGAKNFASPQHATPSFNRADLSFIKSQLDPAVLSALNYTLEPDEGPTTELRAKESVKLAKSIPTLVLKGERHTGTHWLSHVLKHNFAPEQQRLHVEPTIGEDNCPFVQPFENAQQTMCCWTSGKADDRCVFDPQPTVHVFLVRHPYPWLLSMKAHPYEYDRDAAEMDLSEYMRLPFTQFAQEGIGKYANPLDMYNQKVGSYLAFNGSKILLHQEDLYDVEALNKKLLQPLMERGFKLRGGGKSIVYPDFSLDYGQNNPEIYKFTPGDFTGAKVSAANLTMFTTQYSREDLHFIKTQLDPQLLKTLGYELESTEVSLAAMDAEEGAYQGPSMIVRAERHTGSHFLNAVLRRNFPRKYNSVHAEPIMHSSECPVEQPPAARESSCCWKHGYPDEECVYTKEPAAYIFLVRQPYAWLKAMRNNPYEYDCTWCASMGMNITNMSFSEFIRRPYQQQDVNTALIHNNNFSNPVEMWNHKTRAFLRVKKPKLILRQEELFDLGALKRRLPQLTAYGFTLSEEGSVFFPDMYEEKSIRGADLNSPLEYKFSSKGLETARKAAVAEPSSLSRADIDFIKSQLDPEVLRAVGYGSIMHD